MNVYSYEGPVLEFGKVIDPNWKAHTSAVSEKQARNNLTYRYKKEHGRTANSSIRLSGKLKEL